MTIPSELMKAHIANSETLANLPRKRVVGKHGLPTGDDLPALVITRGHWIHRLFAARSVLDWFGGHRWDDRASRPGVHATDVWIPLRELEALPEAEG